MESFTRPLSDAERRLLTCHLRRLERERTSHWPRVIGVTLAVVGVLWLLTVLASGSPLWVVTAFWAILGVLLAVWVGRDRGGMAAPDLVRGLETALRGGDASVTRIEARRYAEIEEAEDEGAHLALELVDGSLTFLSGQDSYPTPRFPSERIDYVDVRNPEGATVLSLRSCAGRRLSCARVLPAEIKSRMRWPGDLAIRRGSLEALEEILGATGVA